MAKEYTLTEVEYRVIRHCMEYTLQKREMSDIEKEYIQVVKEKLESRHQTKNRYDWEN